MPLMFHVAIFKTIRRARLRDYLRDGNHHFFLSGVESPEEPQPELVASIGPADGGDPVP